MAYNRVIPRDLFNESDLLKCYARLWILLDKQGNGRATLDEGDGSAFKIEQDDSSGALTVANLAFSINGRSYYLSRPLNARSAWPLYAHDEEGDETRVFDEHGEFSAEFATLIAEA